MIAAQLRRLLDASLGPGLPVLIRAWDGSEAGPDGAGGRGQDLPVLVVRHRRALRRLLWAPNEAGLVRAIVAGELDVEGDLLALLTAYLRAKERVGPTTRPVPKRELLATAVKLGAVGPRPGVPAEEVRLRGRRHSRHRDRAAVSSHYDVGNDFYRLILGPSLVYSCAYWQRPPGQGSSLETAQQDKLDLVCRKLGLHQRGPGTRLLDVGCGWGSLALHAAEHYDVRVVGITLSAAQVERARQRVRDAGLDQQVEIRLQDYREVRDGPYDAIASVGMGEHVGRDRYDDYARRLHDLLRPGGRLLNHQIACPPAASTEGAPGLISAYVFPDGELLPLADTVSALERSGLEVRDVESLREHYALTLRCWLANLEREWDRAVALTSAARARLWRLYLAGSAVAFATGQLGVNQVLAVKPCPDGASLLPLTRQQLLAPSSR